MYITVSPAYGRDYRSKKDALTDWLAGKDFFLEAIDGRPASTYCSKSDFKKGTTVSIRYAKKTKQLLHLQE